MWTGSQKDGLRKTFYSSTPGRTGQREANAKADAWLDENVINTRLNVEKTTAASENRGYDGGKKRKDANDIS